MNNKFNPFDKFNKSWALVTAGNENSFNTMTVSWGTMGTIWSKSVVVIYVRPERYTHKFLMENDYFSVSFYDEKYKKELAVLGTKSGRDTDKVKEVNFEPIFTDNIVTFKQASETYVLKKLYVQQFDKNTVPDFTIEKYYHEDGFTHYMFVGEVIKVIRN